MNVLACAFTGHRPNRFSFGYNENDERCLKIKALMFNQIRKLVVEGTEIFCTGMAIGVDIWAAEIVLELKKTYPFIRLIAIVPCRTQADRWSEEQKERYRIILTACDEVIILNEHYTSGCMHQRNRMLVDCADYLLAVYDGGETGGTAYTVKYGKQKHRQTTIIHPDTLAVTSATDIETLYHCDEIRSVKNIDK